MIVMKFGGTSVADAAAIERLITIVRAERQVQIQPESGDWRGPIVVVSALGGATDRLLGVAAEAAAGDREGAIANLRDLRRRHLDGGRSRARPGGARPRARVHRTRVRRARTRGGRAGRAEGSVAALAGRHRRDGRDCQQPAGGRGAVERTGLLGVVGGCAARRRHRRRAHGGGAAAGRRRRAALMETVDPVLRARPHSGDRRLRRRDGGRRDDDAGPRRLRLFGRDRRRRASKPTRSRSGPTSTACSPPTRASSIGRGSCRTCRSPRPRSWPTSARRCCIRRRSSPRWRGAFPVRILNSHRPDGARHAHHGDRARPPARRFRPSRPSAASRWWTSLPREC